MLQENLTQMGPKLVQEVLSLFRLPTFLGTSNPKPLLNDSPI
jgi:hypothetical protein